MTELNLYLFLEDNFIEYYWEEDIVTILVRYDDIHLLHDLIGSLYLLEEEESFIGKMGVGYMSFIVNDLCKYFDINMKNVFKGEHITQSY